MAGFLDLIDNTLEKGFNAPVYDPAKGRARLVRVIDNAAKQHKDGVTRAPNRAWKLGNNNSISFAAKIDGKPVMIGGKEANFVPAERFQDFLAQLKKAVEAGQLDDEIKLASEATAPSSKAASSGAQRTYSEESLLNIKVGGFRRGANPKDWKEIRSTLVGEGYDAAKVDAAIKLKQGKEKA